MFINHLFLFQQIMSYKEQSLLHFKPFSILNPSLMIMSTYFEEILKKSSEEK